MPQTTIGKFSRLLYLCLYINAYIYSMYVYIYRYTRIYIYIYIYVGLDSTLGSCQGSASALHGPLPSRSWQAPGAVPLRGALRGGGARDPVRSCGPQSYIVDGI